MSWIIRLQRLPLSANATDIRNFFMGLRIPDGAVHIVGGPDGDAFIGFATDEDARQAMKFDQRRIHDQRVRLLLSSRVEMDAVIAKARAGDLGEAAPLTAVGTPSPPRHNDSPQSVLPRPGLSSASIADPYGIQRTATGDVYAIRNGTHLQQEYNRANAADDAWGRSDAQTDSWKSGGQVAYDIRSANNRQPTVAQQSHHPVVPWQDPKVLNVLSQTTQANSIYQQANREYGQFEQENTFQGYNASVQPTTTSSTSSYSSAVYQQTSAATPQLIQGQSLTMPPAIPSLIVPPLIAATTLTTATHGIQAAPAVAAVHPFAPYTGRNGPVYTTTAIVQSQAAAAMKKENCYIELSRLPTELLRPAALEQFLRPSVPLTLSAVKVVFDPKGFPLHSLVRFENPKDAEKVLCRDGEQGIRIRSCTKEMFEDAVDGSLQIPPAFLQTRTDKEMKNRNARGDSTSRHYHSPERRDYDARHDDRARPSRDREDRYRGNRRARTRSRSPIRDYRDLRRRGEDPERYCVEFTNLPFRVTEAEIREFFGARCDPAKITRAYNEDGQASDRWIAEFTTFDEAENAYHIRGKVQERPLRARRITNEEADKMLSVPDKFGRQRKEEYDRKHVSFPEMPAPTPLLEVQTSAHFTNPSGSQDFLSHFQPPFRGRGRGRGGHFRGGGFAVNGVDRESHGGAFAGSNGPSAPNSGRLIPPPRFPAPRARGAPLLQGGPRQPLIAPPTFFGTVTSSTIKQRGPPPPGHGPTPLRGPRPSHQPPNNGPAGPIVHPSNGPAIPPPAAKTCVILENIPDKTSDSDVAKFLQIPVTKVNSKTRLEHDGKIYLDLGSMEEANKCVLRCNGNKFGENVVVVKAISKQQMIEDQNKEVTQASSAEAVADPGLIASLGEPGTVINCRGFPAKITLPDVKQFFGDYSLVESSVRIKLDDGGTPTGECLLALGSPEEASKAVAVLSGQKLGGSTVTLNVVHPVC